MKTLDELEGDGEKPVLIRRAAAWQLAKGLGLSRYAFDLLVGEGCVARVKVVGEYDHYRRDKLMEIFERAKGRS